MHSRPFSTTPTRPSSSIRKDYGVRALKPRTKREKFFTSECFNCLKPTRESQSLEIISAIPHFIQEHQPISYDAPNVFPPRLSPSQTSVSRYSLPIKLSNTNGNRFDYAPKTPGFYSPMAARPRRPTFESPHYECGGPKLKITNSTEPIIPPSVNRGPRPKFVPATILPFVHPAVNRSPVGRVHPNIDQQLPPKTPDMGNGAFVPMQIPSPPSPKSDVPFHQLPSTQSWATCNPSQTPILVAQPIYVPPPTLPHPTVAQPMQVLPYFPNDVNMANPYAAPGQPNAKVLPFSSEETPLSECYKLQKNNQVLMDQLDQCNHALHEAQKQNQQHRTDYINIVQKMCASLEKFDLKHDSHDFPCVNTKQIGELKALIQLLRAELQCALMQHAHKDAQSLLETLSPPVHPSSSKDRSEGEAIEKELDLLQNSQNLLSHSGQALISGYYSVNKLNNDRKADNTKQKDAAGTDAANGASATLKFGTNQINISDIESFSSEDTIESSEEPLQQIEAKATVLSGVAPSSVASRVPALPTEKAGKGSWFNGEQTPLEYS